MVRAERKDIMSYDYVLAKHLMDMESIYGLKFACRRCRMWLNDQNSAVGRALVRSAARLAFGRGK